MRSLKESILRTTGTGLTKILKEVKEWVYSIANIKYIREMLEDIEVIPEKNDFYKINLISKSKQHDLLKNRYLQSIIITTTDCQLKKMPYKISEICLDNETLDVAYKKLQFETSNEIIKRCAEELRLYSCIFSKIDTLPNGCKKLLFIEAKGLSSSTSNIVKEIKNIKVDEFNICDPYALTCNIDCIKNITVTNKCVIDDSIISLANDVFVNKNLRPVLTDSATQKIFDFIKNNKINLNEFYLRYSVSNSKLPICKKIVINKNKIILKNII